MKAIRLIRFLHCTRSKPRGTGRIFPERGQPCPRDRKTPPNRADKGVRAPGGSGLAAICALAFIGVLVFLTFTSDAQETARLPYSLIYKMQEAQTNLSQTFTNLYMFLRISPTNPAIKLADVKAYIDSKNTHLLVSINPTNGNFSVHMRENLLGEETWINVNQPHGTMSFQWYMGLTGVKVPTNGIHYRELVRPVEDMVRIHREMAKIPGVPPMGIPGLKMLFPNNLDATVVIHAKVGDKPLKTDSSHSIFLSVDPVLLTEDPEVSIPVLPETVLVAEPGSDN